MGHNIVRLLVVCPGYKNKMNYSLLAQQDANCRRFKLLFNHVLPSGLLTKWNIISITGIVYSQESD